MTVSKQRYFAMFLSELDSEQINDLIMQYGLHGLGVYVALKEILFRTENNTFTTDPKKVAFAIKENTDKTREIITYLITESGLFSVDDEGKHFYSNYINENVQRMTEISEKRRKAGKKGARERWNNNY